jgi:hypothetical protein
MKAEATYKDRWNSVHFTSSDIDAILALLSDPSRMRHNRNGGLVINDARTVPARVRQWMLRWGILEKTREGLTTTWQWNEPMDFLPIEALWRIVRSMLTDGHAGHSIVRHRGWKALNLWVEGEYHFGARDQEEMERLLCELSSYGYIYAQFSGSVWSIDERNDRVAA